jgi:hypothetical protein
LPDIYSQGLQDLRSYRQSFWGRIFWAGRMQLIASSQTFLSPQGLYVDSSSNSANVAHVNGGACCAALCLVDYAHGGILIALQVLQTLSAI